MGFPCCVKPVHLGSSIGVGKADDVEEVRALLAAIFRLDTEAVALHHALDKIDGRRPGTHELAAEILRRLNADIVAARITRYDGGVFYAELDLMTPRGREIFDCRTSDALILATRQGVRAPVLCAESVLQAFYA